MKKTHAISLSLLMLMSTGFGGWKFKTKAQEKNVNDLIETSITPNAENNLQILLKQDAQLRDSIAAFTYMLNPGHHDSVMMKKLNNVVKIGEQLTAKYNETQHQIWKKLIPYALNDEEYDWERVPQKLIEEYDEINKPFLLSNDYAGILIPAPHTEIVKQGNKTKEIYYDGFEAEYIEDFERYIDYSIVAAHGGAEFQDLESTNGYTLINIAPNYSLDHIREIIRAYQEFTRALKRTKKIKGQPLANPQTIAAMEAALADLSAYVKSVQKTQDQTQKKLKDFETARGQLKQKINATRDSTIKTQKLLGDSIKNR